MRQVPLYVCVYLYQHNTRTQGNQFPYVYTTQHVHSDTTHFTSILKTIDLGNAIIKPASTQSKVQSTSYAWSSMCSMYSCSVQTISTSFITRGHDGCKPLIHGHAVAAIALYTDYSEYSLAILKQCLVTWYNSSFQFLLISTIQSCRQLARNSTRYWLSKGCMCQ